MRVRGLADNGGGCDSVYLRAWGDDEHHRLKLTASHTSGAGRTALRASSAEALHRRVNPVQRRGLGISWADGDRGIGPTYLCRDSGGHEFALYWDTNHFAPPRVPGRR